MRNRIVKILAIDNRELNLTELEALLLGIFPLANFRHAVSGTEALAFCRQEIPDIVLIDIDTTVIDGYEICKILKSDQSFRSIPVIMIFGANTDRECRIKALECGVDAFLRKPMDDTEFLVQISAMLRMKDAEEARRCEKQQLEELVFQRTEALEKELEQRKNAEESALRAEIYFRSLIEKAPDGIVLVGAGGKLTYASPSARRIFGYSDDEATLPDPMIFTHPEDLHSVLAVLENIALNPSLVDTLEYRFRKKAGEWIWVESTFSNQIAEPGIEAIVINFRDITERKKVEEKIHRSEILYRTLVETSPDGIAMTDLNGTLITVNNRACKIFGFNNEVELKADHENFMEFVSHSDRARVMENFKQRLSGIESFCTEYMAIGKDGREFPIETKSSMVYDSQNSPYAIIGVVRDISQLRKIENAQQFLLGCGWTKSGEDFFHSLVRYLSVSSDMSYASINRLSQDGLVLEPLAVYSDGSFTDKDSYLIKDTPDVESIGKTICIFDRDVQNLFPIDHLLKDIEAECYVGTTLWSLEGKPIGLIVLMNNQPLENPTVIVPILNLISIRAAGELERLDTEIALYKSRKAFQDYFQSCSVGMSVTSSDKKWLEVNQSLSNMLGYSKEELESLTWIDLTFPDDIEKNLRLFDKLEGGLIDRYEMDKRFVRKDGSIVYTSLSSVCERNPDKSIHHLLTSYIDVSARHLAEESILHERALLRTLIDNLPVNIYVKDAQGRKIISNKADLVHMGLTSESEIIGKTDVDLFSVTDGERGYQEDLAVIQTGLPLINNEIEFIDSMGVKHWLTNSKYPLYNDNRKVQGLVGIGYDITERKIIENALEESEELYRNLVEKMPDGVYKSTHAGKFVSVNPAMVAILGYDSKEDLKSIDIKKDLYLEKEENIRLISNDKEDSFHIYKMKRKDGSEIWVEDNGWYTQDEKGNVLYHEGIVRDVTERKNAENKLRILSRTVEQNPASIIITDALGNIEFVNAAFTALTQYSIDEVINKPPRIFNTGHIPEMDFNLMWEVLHAGKVWKGEFQNRRKSGTAYWEKVTISSLMNNKDEISNYILIMDDISEKKKMLDELISAKDKAEESNRLKSAFLATMNHELRTPLNHILGFSELIMSNVAPEDNSSFASSIQISGQSLLSIIEGVFDLALVEQAHIQLRNQTFSLMDHFMENKASFDNILRTSAKHEQIQLVFRPDTQWLSSYVTADRSKINQVLTNLFKNAVKFTHKGTIEFGFKIENESNLVLYIKDTGIGIPKEKQSIIFDFFRQGDDSYTKEYGGIGIGLAIAKKISEILRGKLNVVSMPGQGSTFSLSIPVELSAIKE